MYPQNVSIAARVVSPYFSASSVAGNLRIEQTRVDLNQFEFALRGGRVTVSAAVVPGGAQAIYENPQLGYITRQVERFQADWANFPTGSSRT